MNKNYAFIKNGIVENIVVFDNPSNELLDYFKEDKGLEYIIEVDDTIKLNAIYNGNSFRNPSPGPDYIFDEVTQTWIPEKPFPSAILVDGMWQTPLPYPNDTENIYNWDESSLSWVLQE